MNKNFCILALLLCSFLLSGGDCNSSNSNNSTTTTSASTALPKTFYLSSPLSGMGKLSITPTLNWIDSTGETSYTLDIATDYNFTSITHTASLAANTTNYAVPSSTLSASKLYYWRVVATNGSGSTTAYNAPYSFNTDAVLPGTFALSSPAKYASDQSYTPTLAWANASANEGYTLEISTATSFSSLVYSVNLPANTTSYGVPSGTLTQNIYYYWRVTANNVTGTTTASNAPFAFKPARSWTHPSSLSDNISPDGQAVFSPQVAMDNNGNAIIVWRQFDGFRDQIFKSEYRSGSWTHPSSLSDNISPDGQDASSPQVAMDNNGNAIIVWYQFDGSRYRIFKSEYRSNSWTHPSSISNNISPNGQDASSPQVAMDNNGNSIIVWYQLDGSNNYQIFSKNSRGSLKASPKSMDR